MSTDVSSSEASGIASVDLKLEVVVIPVSDVDRAKEFYGGLGWRLDADFPFDNGFRVVQFTPPGSGCSVQFGTKMTSATPGSAHGNYLIVSDVAAAREDLIAHGVTPSEVFYPGEPGAQFQSDGSSGRVNGPAPDHASYSTFVTFSDPDGNGWLLQEITTRLPGRIDAAETSFASGADLEERSGGRLLPTASTKSAPAKPTRTGPSGMRRTWWRSRPGQSCRRDRRHRYRRRSSATSWTRRREQLARRSDIDGGQQLVET